MATNNDNQTFIERYLTPIAVVLGALIIALALYYGHSSGAATSAGTTGSQPAAQAATQAVNIASVKTDGEPYIGSPNAPLTMALWFDYQCPFCKQFDLGALSQIYQNYVQTGKVKVVFKDFPFLGNDSIAGAEFARGVWALYPAQFYDWYLAMFNAQDAEGDTGFGNQATIIAMTKVQVPQIDTDKVVAYITANQSTIDAEVSADRTEGTSFGIQGTPSMIVGTTLLQGAQDYTTVQKLLDAQLAQ